MGVAGERQPHQRRPTGQEAEPPVAYEDGIGDRYVEEPQTSGSRLPADRSATVEEQWSNHKSPPKSVEKQILNLPLTACGFHVEERIGA